jgi:protein-S-isoprenylcysteine O-methyltransferase Ste14
MSMSATAPRCSALEATSADGPSLPRRDRGAQRRGRHSLYLSGFLAAATVLEAVVPLSVVAYPSARYVAGAIFIVAGFAGIFAAAGRFRAAGTNIPPDLPTTALVTEGIYARTRNPFYLGSTLVYLGLAVAAGSLWAIVLMVPMLWVINVGVVAREERYLERKFGEAYRTYKGRVRRWV